MSIENIILLGVVIVLSVILYRTLGAQEQQTPKMPEKLRLISEKTGHVIEMKIVDDSLSAVKREFDEATFLSLARVLFQSVSDAFTKGDLHTLKGLLAPEVYEVFEKDVVERKKNKQTVDFSLVCFDTVEILGHSAQKDEITVRFVTEQINLLKNESGVVLEGDAMTIATVNDTWTFKKKGRSKWLVSATKSGVI